MASGYEKSPDYGGPQRAWTAWWPNGIAVVADFNAKLAAGIRHDELMASPLLRAALISGHHWMHVHCPRCDSQNLNLFQVAQIGDSIRR